MIATFVAAGAMVEPVNGRNPLVDQAQDIFLLPDESPEEAARMAELDQIRGPKISDSGPSRETIPNLNAQEVVDGEVIGVQVGSQPQPGEPGYVDEAAIPDGSFEQFLGRFGGVPPR